MSSNDTVEAVVAEVLVDLLCVNQDEVQPGATLFEDLGADSIDMVEIALELEDRFDMDIPDDVLESAATVADLCNLVRQHVSVV